jgi:putative tricarboxylic transport membrane protein
MRKGNWPLAPLILGFILGSMMEQSLRQSISMGGPGIFLARPLALGFIVAAVILTVVSIRVLRRVPAKVLDQGAAEAAA